MSLIPTDISSGTTANTTHWTQLLQSFDADAAAEELEAVWGIKETPADLVAHGIPGVPDSITSHERMVHKQLVRETQKAIRFRTDMRNHGSDMVNGLESSFAPGPAQPPSTVKVSLTGRARHTRRRLLLSRARPRSTSNLIPRRTRSTPGSGRPTSSGGPHSKDVFQQQAAGFLVLFHPPRTTRRHSDTRAADSAIAGPDHA